MIIRCSTLGVNKYVGSRFCYSSTGKGFSIARRLGDSKKLS